VSDEKELPSGEKRFVAKEQVTGRHTTWNVYDRQRACYPRQVPGFGTVASGFPEEAECQVEADRLEAFTYYQAQAADMTSEEATDA
jgi:hypothetical protein